MAGLAGMEIQPRVGLRLHPLHSGPPRGASHPGRGVPQWITTLVCAEESSVQVEVAFTAALIAEDLLDTADATATAALRQALLSGDRNRVTQLTGDGQLPLLLAISDNGPQMRSHTTREFLAGVAIAQQFGRPHPQDQAWIETLFGHVKGEWPHLEKIRDPAELERELDHRQLEYNTVRLHAGLGYVTPRRRTPRPRRRHPPSRRDRLTAAREARINYPRTTIKEPTMITTRSWLGIPRPTASLTRHTLTTTHLLGF